MQFAQFSENGEDLSYACGGVLCKHSERIQNLVALKWKSKTFSVLVEEELGEWIPDCLVDFEVKEDDPNIDVMMDSATDNGIETNEGRMPEVEEKIQNQNGKEALIEQGHGSID
ncbi:hypothetical protein HanIR_Chr15g0737431 [Helianthus annuus]|nr:hypothetical protein HanIR_Chr15g0737431 [Helianthus annuus]